MSYIQRLQCEEKEMGDKIPHCHTNHLDYLANYSPEACASGWP
ncbi:hypothetical protein FORC066_3446 [Yersinia enterocolitica]|nr:hypothetical protein FORC065_1086 [Yersinia enterocolitica]UXD30653.1 hypothetical protein FORC066_3446 [Yersinia enterocolitica]